MKLIYQLFLLVSTVCLSFTNSVGQFYVNGGQIKIDAAIVSSNVPFVNDGGIVEQAGGEVHYNNGFTNLSGAVYNHLSGIINLDSTWRQEGTFYHGQGVVNLFNCDTLIHNDTLYALSTNSNDVNIEGFLYIQDSLALITGDLEMLDSGDTLEFLDDYVISNYGVTGQLNGPVIVGAVGDNFLPTGNGSGANFRPIILRNIPVKSNQPRFLVYLNSSGFQFPTLGNDLININNNFHWRVLQLSGDTIEGGFLIEGSYGSSDGFIDSSQIVLASSSTDNGAYNSLGQSNLVGNSSSGSITSAIGLNQSYVRLGTSNNSYVDLKVLLQGPYVALADSMKISTLALDGIEWHDELVSLFEAGGTSMRTMLEGYNVPKNTIDTINISLRSTASGSEIANKTAFLLSDGTVTDFESGQLGYVNFGTVPNSNYYIVVKHRNHLSVMSSNLVSISSTVPLTALSGADFTDIINVYGGGAVMAKPSTFAMIAGDVDDNNDGQINAFDYYQVRKDELSILQGYQPSDANIDGFVNSLDGDVTSISNDNLFFSTVP